VLCKISVAIVRRERGDRYHGQADKVPSEAGDIAGAEKSIASVSDIFALQGDAALRDLERAYLR
jgi:hypothetical protein